MGINFHDKCCSETFLVVHQRKRHHKLASLTIPVAHAHHSPPVCLDQLSNYSQSNSQASAVETYGMCVLNVRVKNKRKRFGRNANSVVGNTNPQNVSLHGYRQLDA